MFNQILCDRLGVLEISGRSRLQAVCGLGLQFGVGGVVWRRAAVEGDCDSASAGGLVRLQRTLRNRESDARCRTALLR
jgi:hypothetical protein